MSGTLKKIMIVDDSPSIIKFLEMVLGKERYAVISYGNGLDAVDSVEEESPDLIVMDMNMPKLGGIDAARTIKQNIKTSHIPIIIISGHDQEEEVRKAREAGADDFLVKPYAPEQLLEIIKEKIERADRNLRDT